MALVFYGSWFSKTCKNYVKIFIGSGRWLGGEMVGVSRQKHQSLQQASKLFQVFGGKVGNLYLLKYA